MCVAFALANVEGHASVAGAHPFSCPGSAHKWSRIHVSRPQLEGNVRNDGGNLVTESGAGKGQL